MFAMATPSRDAAAPTADELHTLEQMERQALARVSEAVTRPTKAAFAWADPLFTVGVTGTNGKTSTTHLIAAVLRAAGETVLLESTIGYFLNDLPLAVARTSRGYVAAMKQAAEAGARFAAVEVTSAALAGGFARVWRYDLGVFTNLTRDHVVAHGSWEHYLASKAQLFVHLAPGRCAVLNAADPAALLIDQITPADVRRRFFAVPSRGACLHPAELLAAKVEVSVEGTRILLAPSASAESLGGELETGLIGEIFAENVLAAALSALELGVGARVVQRGMKLAPPIEGRFQVVSREPIVVVDYAHSPDALARTADTARSLAGAARTIFVAGAGGGADTPKREPMGRALGERVDYLILTSDNPRDENPADIAAALEHGARRGGRAHVRTELDRRAAIRQAIEQAKPKDVVVIAGKGHERGQTMGTVTEPFSDVDEALAVLGALRGG